MKTSPGTNRAARLVTKAGAGPSDTQFLVAPPVTSDRKPQVATEADPQPAIERIASAVEALVSHQLSLRQDQKIEQVTEELVTASSKAIEKLKELATEQEKAEGLLNGIAEYDTLISLSGRSRGSLAWLGHLLNFALQRNEIFKRALDVFDETSDDLLGAANSGCENDSPKSRLEIQRTVVSGFVRMITETAADLEVRGDDLSRLMEGIVSLHQRQRSLMGVSAERDDDSPWATTPKSELKIPILENGPFITSLMFDLGNVLPRLDDVQKLEEEGKGPSEALYRFATDVLTLSDLKLTKSLTDDALFAVLSEVLSIFDKASRTIHSVLKEAGLHKALGLAYEDGSRVFAEFFAEASKIRREGVQADAGGNKRQTDQLLGELRRMKLAAKDLEPATEVPTRKECEELFLRISTILRNTSKARSDESEERVVVSVENLHELLQLRDDAYQISTKTEKQKRKQRDADRGKTCFELVGGDSGALRFERVPAHPASFKDLIGASWKDVCDHVERLIRTQQMRVVYEALSPRGKVNNNLLIVGPYGMGKNHFIRGLEGREEIVLVRASTDRLMSKWLGTAERNVRKLYELAQKTSERYKKPVIIALDEIDQFFPAASDDGNESAHHAVRGMQKTLQTVLDGDTHYDGVALIGLTNEPKRIPVPIYRRFGNVVIVREFTVEERQRLLRGFAAHLPVEEKWDQRFDWKRFDKESAFVSGEQLGIIADELFESCVMRLNRDAQKSDAVVSALTERKQLTSSSFVPPAKRRFWLEHAPSALIDLETFSDIVFGVLGKPHNLGARSQQKKFYDHVDDLMGEAFGRPV